MNKILKFYTEGFRNMKTGKLLWKIIIIKLIIMFVIIKTFFYTNKDFSRLDNSQKANSVRKKITTRQL